MIWDKTVVSQDKDLGNCVELFWQFVQKSLWLFATSYLHAGGLSPAAAALKRQSTSELNQSRIVHLSGSDAAKVGASRVRIRGIKARMIEDVEGVEAEL